MKTSKTSPRKGHRVCINRAVCARALRFSASKRLCIEDAVLLFAKGVRHRLAMAAAK